MAAIVSFYSESLTQQEDTVSHASGDTFSATPVTAPNHSGYHNLDSLDRRRYVACFQINGHERDLPVGLNTKQQY